MNYTNDQLKEALKVETYNANVLTAAFVVTNLLWIAITVCFVILKNS